MNTWQIREGSFDPKKLHVRETVYTIGNGYFGTRGTFEEGYLGASPATLLYGVFDSISIGKEELANAPDWLSINLIVNGERFCLNDGKILAYQRVLDIRNGVLTRTVRWDSPNGICLKIQSERFASLADENIGAIRYSVTAEEQPAVQGDLNLILQATINTAVGNNDLMHWESVDQGHEDDVIWLQSQTRHTGVQLVQAMSFTTQAAGFSKHLFDSVIAPSIEFQGKLAAGETLTAEKIVVMFTSRDVEAPRQAALNHHMQIMQASQSVGGSAYETLLAEQIDAWQDFWQVSDVIIEGDDKAQQAVRYSVYQLRISVSPDDSRYSIAAKGLTGFGYRGHIFHDTEIFMLPFFTYVHPDIARTLLLYRYHLLPAARAKAKHNGFEGAQFPWESTLDGLEATPDGLFHPESGEFIPVLDGRIELHITASIAFANWQYWHVTGDGKYMRDYGAEILLSTAQFWVSRAQYSPERHDYEINDVIGPDEWHEHVNNNAYTNYMARWNIQTAIDILSWLHTHAPEKARDLTKQLNLTDQLLEHWGEVIAGMHIPQEEEAGLFEQFDGFFTLRPIDQEKYKGRTASFRAILGMQAIQQYQIINQADVLLLLTLLRNRFNLRTKRANWNYYYPITDHDFGSSLTPALHVILACELGQIDIAYDLFMKGALVDLENLRFKTEDGIHIGSCGAVWQAVIMGFAGLHLTDDSYSFNPCLPRGWTRLAFTIKYKGKPIVLDLKL